VSFITDHAILKATNISIFFKYPLARAAVCLKTVASLYPY
ncbi:MAG: hypothetical protein ACJA01_000647, partial [Saprospiraceae bacterium]